MVSLAAGPTDLCLLTVLTDALALLLVGAAGEQVRQEGQHQQDGPGGDGHIQAGGMLDVIGCVAQLGNGKHRGADDVFIMDEAAVLGVVGVALGTEAQSGGIVLVGDHLHHPVGGHGVLIQHEGDDLPRLDGGGVHLFYVDEGAHMVSGFHGPGQDGEGADAGQSDADQRHGQKYCQRHQNGADDL